MRLSEFTSGYNIINEDYDCFMPKKISHDWFWDDNIINDLLGMANYHLGELNALSAFIPNLDWFIKLHVAKEAVTSSRIEGTRTELLDTFKQEQDIAPNKINDWKEVSNYIDAMNTAIEELENEPFSSDIILKMHKVLMEGVRGVSPGEYRKEQNWIGGSSKYDAKFTPPPFEYVQDLMNDLDIFLTNKKRNIPPLIKIAIAHYQFLTIHPFSDGNGRVGRLMVPIYLIDQKVLTIPSLYLSEYFERNKGNYYDNLTWVRDKNDMKGWIKFFLVALMESAKESLQDFKRIFDLKSRITTEKIPLFGKRADAAGKLLKELFNNPLTTSSEVIEMLDVSAATANSLLEGFVEKRILEEITGGKRNRIYVFDEYLNIFK